LRIQKIVWKYLISAIIASTHAGNASANSCETLDAKANAREIERNPAAFDPAAVFVKHGLDPAKLKSRFEISDIGQIQLSLIYDEQRAGYIILEHYYRGDLQYDFTIARVQVEPQLKGKGLGTLLYLAAGRKAYIRENRLLYMSAIVSNDAIKTWNRFVDQGYAEKHMTEYGEEVRLKRSTLESDSARKALEFVEARPVGLF
jgi:hypothetical protein